MDALTSSLRLKWVPVLPSVAGRPPFEVIDWLAKGTYAPSAVDGAVCLQGIDGSSFASAIAKEINRLSLACSETLHVVQEKPECPKSAAWVLVKAYYAALFAAHALLRTWGKWPTYLRTLDLIALRDTFKAYGVVPPFTLVGSPFIVHANLKAGEVILRKGQGGTHEEVWSSVVKQIGELKSLIKSSVLVSSDKEIAEHMLSQLVKLMTSNGKSDTWMSMQRNDIQYRQSFGVWYPYKGRKKVKDLCEDVESVIKGNWNLKEGVKWKEDDIDRFWSACLCLVVIMRLTLSDMRSVNKEKSFLAHGFLHFERTLK